MFDYPGATLKRTQGTLTGHGFVTSPNKKLKRASIGKVPDKTAAVRQKARQTGAGRPKPSRKPSSQPPRRSLRVGAKALGEDANGDESEHTAEYSD